MADYHLLSNVYDTYFCLYVSGTECTGFETIEISIYLCIYILFYRLVKGI